MDHLYEKIAYLKGLSEGIELEESTKEGKLLYGIIELMEEVVEEVEDMKYHIGDLEDYTEVLDEDLTDIEVAVFEGYDDEDEYDDFDDFEDYDDDLYESYEEDIEFDDEIEDPEED